MEDQLFLLNNGRFIPINITCNSSPRRNTVYYLNLLLIIFIIIFIIGLLTFRYGFNQNWINSIYYTLTFGITAGDIIQTDAQRLFVAFYFIIVGFLFVAVASHLIEHIMDFLD